MMPVPLEGLRVLDLASMIAGPYGATMLGDMGADVIKIESPSGDEARSMGPRIGNDSGLFVGVNRNKRGLVLDLTTPEGRDLYFRLVATSDIVIENMRPQAKRRLGVSYKDLVQHNERIICISVSAFGQSGPYAGRPGIDPLAQAMTGFMGVTGERDGRPLKSGPAVADITCAHLVAYAAMVGLWARLQQGVGQAIEVNLIDGLIHAQAAQVGQFFLNKYVQPRMGNSSPFYGPYGTFQCREGSEIFVAAHNDKFFRRICSALDRDDLIADPRFATVADRVANQNELESELRPAFAAKTRDEMMATLIAADVMAAPVNSYDQAFLDPQVRHNQMSVRVEHPRVGTTSVGGIPVKLSKTPGSVRRAPPILGQHSSEILQELGLSDDDIARLREIGVTD